MSRAGASQGAGGWGGRGAASGAGGGPGSGSQSGAHVLGAGELEAASGAAVARQLGNKPRKAEHRPGFQAQARAGTAPPPAAPGLGAGPRTGHPGSREAALTEKGLTVATGEELFLLLEFYLLILEKGEISVCDSTYLCTLGWFLHVPDQDGATALGVRTSLQPPASAGLTAWSGAA